ncbi:MAG: hybrid sensor histidine kinase/response regulator [Proteobacteria bacterium]|nr:hybrid sensor histidine kinase/response regulator [Pseudomonadota bacterium]
MNTAAPPLARLVETQLARDYLALIPAALVTHLVGAALMLWPLAAGARGARWYAAYLLLNALRMLAWGLYRRDARWQTRPSYWVRHQALGLFCSGLLWGAAPWLFLAQAPALGQIYVFATIVVMAIGTTVVNAPFQLARLAFAVPALTLGASRAFVEGGAQYEAIGAVLLCSLPVVIFLGAQWGGMLAASVRMRHENTTLVEELSKQKAAAERAIVARSEFFAAANHDLRQPVHALGLYAAALRDADKGRRSAALAEKIGESVDALESLFDELLDIARIDSGGVLALPRDFRLQQVFDRLSAAYRPTAEQDAIRLRFARTRRVAATDPLLLERILSNLVANALRFAPGAAVLVGARQRGTHIAIEVRDRGAGIAAADQARIFDEFIQLANPERDRRQGLGLGLATVKRLAELLDLPLELDSAAGHGSTFRVLVPSGNEAAVADSDPVVSPIAPQDRLRGCRVLVVDDEEAVRDAMTELFQHWQCECISVRSGAEAEQLAGKPPDALIVDYRLPGTASGLQVIETLRSRYGSPIPALLITGDARDEVLRAARAAGLPVLTKPVRAARLRAVLAHLLQTQGE